MCTAEIGVGSMNVNCYAHVLEEWWWREKYTLQCRDGLEKIEGVSLLRRRIVNLVVVASSFPCYHPNEHGCDCRLWEQIWSRFSADWN
ncbi:hypothetical protein AAHA92_29112 [Salvia divinorum]|uniref:Uncharacterized protein n=1 Tax=Salvia divinorum TaxID=28513 RepID=A0ABD1G0F2_SALDI